MSLMVCHSQNKLNALLCPAHTAPWIEEKKTIKTILLDDDDDVVQLRWYSSAGTFWEKWTGTFIIIIIVVAILRPKGLVNVIFMFSISPLFIFVVETWGKRT